MSLGIIVCITLIFEALEYVVLNPFSFHDVYLEIMLFSSFILGRVTWCPSKLNYLWDGLLLGEYMKIHRMFPPYLSLSIFIPFISPILVWEIGLATLGRVVPYLVGRRG
jgi:hypothetical protein